MGSFRTLAPEDLWLTSGVQQGVLENPPDLLQLCSIYINAHIYNIFIS